MKKLFEQQVTVVDNWCGPNHHAIKAEVSAHYADGHGVLLVELSAWCTLDGCDESFPRENAKRHLLTEHNQSMAIRATIELFDALVAELRPQVADHGKCRPA